MRRIGFIGTENSHTDHFIRFLNTEERHPGYRATALVGGRSARNEALAEAGRIDLVVENPEDLVGQVDAVILSTRDGALHREQAEPLLAAGVPVLVDKPLAASVADAQAIIAGAERTGAALVSCSALRFVAEIADFAAPHERGECRQLNVIGPADPDSEYSGLFFYGIHHVETALELLGNPVVEPGSLEPIVTRHGDTTVALTRIAGVDVVFTFITPGGDHRAPFCAVSAGTNGVLARQLTLERDYNAPALERFITTLESATPAPHQDHLLSPVAVLAAITDALDASGKDKA